MLVHNKEAIMLMQKLANLNRYLSKPIEVTLPDGRIVVVNDLEYSQLLKAGIISRNYPARRVDL